MSLQLPGNSTTLVADTGLFLLSVRWICVSVRWVVLAALCACTSLLLVRLTRMAASCWSELPPARTPLAAGPDCLCHRHRQVPRGGALRTAVMSGRDGGAAIDWRMAAELAERRTRSLAMARDMEMGLPQTLLLPDGEEFPHSANHIHIRTFEQEKEIYQACIRPPPNRTLDGLHLSPSDVAPPITLRKPPGRASIVATSAKTFPSRLDTAAKVMLSSAEERSPLTVIVPSRRRAPQACQLLPFSFGGPSLSGVRVLGCGGVPPVSPPSRTPVVEGDTGASPSGVSGT